VFEELRLVTEQDIAEVALESLQSSVGGQGQVHLEKKRKKRRVLILGKGMVSLWFADQH
jgi:hypothetical protein